METIQTMIANSLKENTGINMCDSGGVKGRLWQQNQSVASFDNQPVVMVDIYDVDDICISYDIYHFLTNHLDVTEQSETLTSVLYATYGGRIDEFLNSPHIDIMYKLDNTYNDDTIISTDIRFATFEHESDYGVDHYIILQIHTGADIRGGYTTPHIYQIEDIYEFIMSMTAVSAQCGCSSLYSSDCGYTFHDTYTGMKADRSTWAIDMNDTPSMICKRCGKPVVFAVTEPW